MFPYFVCRYWIKYFEGNSKTQFWLFVGFFYCYHLLTSAFNIPSCKFRCLLYHLQFSFYHLNVCHLNIMWCPTHRAAIGPLIIAGRSPVQPVHLHFITHTHRTQRVSWGHRVDSWLYIPVALHDKKSYLADTVCSLFEPIFPGFLWLHCSTWVSRLLLVILLK